MRYKFKKNPSSYVWIHFLVLIFTLTQLLTGWPQIFNFPPEVPNALAAPVQIDATIFDATDEYNTSPNAVFTTDQIGYVFYVDGTSDVVYQKTTDGGTSWSGLTILSPDKTWGNVAVWYDQWTPGDTTGTKIHIAAIENDTDDAWYHSLDTNGDILDPSGWVAAVPGTDWDAAADGGVSITKSTDNNLFISAFGAPGGVIGCQIWKSIDGGDNWADTSFTATSGLDDNDEGQLLPLSGGDVLFIMQDITVNKVISKEYDEATDLWGNELIIDSSWVENTVYDVTWGAMVNKATGNVYLAGMNVIASATGDLEAYKFTDSSRTWTTLTEIVLDTATTLQGVIAIDENTGDLYALYSRGTLGGTMEVFYKVSTNDGGSWGTESAALNTVIDDIKYVRTNAMNNERLYAVWYNDDLNDLIGNTIIDLTSGAVLGVTSPANVTLTSIEPSETGETTFATPSELVVVTDGGSGWSLTVQVTTTLSDGGSNTIPDANVKIRKDGVVAGGDTYTIWSGITTNVSETEETVSLDVSRAVGIRSNGTGNEITTVRPTIQVVADVGQPPADYKGILTFTVV